MEPIIREENSIIYKERICWHGVRSKVPGPVPGTLRNEQTICGYAARKYRVQKNPDGATAGQKAYMWLCLKHVKEMEKRGYILVEVL